MGFVCQVSCRGRLVQLYRGGGGWERRARGAIMDGRRSEGCFHERKEERGLLLCGRKSEGCFHGREEERGVRLCFGNRSILLHWALTVERLPKLLYRHWTNHRKCRCMITLSCTSFRPVFEREMPSVKPLLTANVRLRDSLAGRRGVCLKVCFTSSRDSGRVDR